MEYAPLLAIACTAPAASLEWTIDFAEDAPRPPEVASVRAFIVEGGCAGTEIVYDVTIVPSSMTMSPPRLDDGTWGFGAEARDSSCALVAEACEDVVVPGTVEVLLVLDAVRPPGPGCVAPAVCAGGACTAGDAGMIDAGRDAGRDAGPPCPARETSCGDGIDEDCDGPTDCADTDCDHQACSGGRCIGAVCCTTCERGDGACAASATNNACGSGGAPCVACPECAPCNGGACGAPVAGTSCTGGTCAGTPPTCCTGCVSGGTCMPGTSASACGDGGDACIACAVGEGCTSRGCCDGCTAPASGFCRSGRSGASCGNAGAECASCPAGSTCCTVPTGGGMCTAGGCV